MKKLFVMILLGILTFSAAPLLAEETSASDASHTTSAKYSCPMHSEVQEDKPGKCPKCGMDLQKASSKEVASESRGDAHAGHQH